MPSNLSDPDDIIFATWSPLFSMRQYTPRWGSYRPTIFGHKNKVDKPIRLTPRTLPILKEKAGTKGVDIEGNVAACSDTRNIPLIQWIPDGQTIRRSAWSSRLNFKKYHVKPVLQGYANCGSPKKLSVAVAVISAVTSRRNFILSAG